MEEVNPVEYECQHCGSTSVGRGTRGGCRKCGKVISTPDGKIDTKARDKRIKVKEVEA